MPLLEQVLGKYPKEVRLVYKNYPLPNHPFARRAAVAALAAGEQGKFWPVHDALFKNYALLNEQKILQLVGEQGVEMQRYEAAAADPKLQLLIDADLKEGQTIGVRGTPAIFINGRLLQNRSLDGISTMVDGLLKKEAAAPVK